tara:strand:- start:1282 stop:1905 length:624 start_codon:yes stop_codon:yes gene_type:complete
VTILINALNREALRRGLLTGEHRITEEVAFSLVRDMSYERASSRDPLTTISEWKGTCSGKHYLLKDLFEELGMRVSLYAGLIYYSVDSCPWLPEHLRTFVAKEPLPDIHNFLRLETRTGFLKLVDATFPSSVRSHGLVVNDFEPTNEMLTILPVEKEFEIPSGDDPQDFKNTLINKYCGRFVEEREQFISLLSNWLASLADSKGAKL